MVDVQVKRIRAALKRENMSSVTALRVHNLPGNN